MTLSKGNIFAAGIAVLWAASAIASIALREDAGAVLLLWPPSGIAVWALFVAKKGERLPVILALAAGNGILHFWFATDPVKAFGFLCANLADSLLVVGIARQVMRRRGIEALQLRNMVLLFLGSLSGSLVGAVIALPFRENQDVAQFLWWVLSTMLGTTVLGPLIYAANHWIRKLRAREIAFWKSLPVMFLAAQAAMFGLAAWVLDTPELPLGPLMLAGLVFAVVRYGLVGASASVLAVGLAGTLHSFGGHSPFPYVNYEPFAAGVVLQGYMLLMLATSLPLAALLLKHDRLALQLKARNQRMRESLLLLNMAEEVGRIGRWRYNPRTGEQDWSRQMLLINGLDPDLGRDPGDIRSMLPDSGEELFGQLAHHAKDRARYSFEYRIRPPRGGERTLKMYATNEFSDSGELSSMFGVVMDVTEHHQRQEALDQERTRAMRLAAEAQYLAHTDPLTGLANRRRAITQLEKCVRRSEQDNRPLAVISFDIDHFKRINDTNGHQTGDDVLVRVADIARAQARASDLIGRMGGEEFVWLLPDAGAEEASAAAERLRQAIERDSAENGLPRVTASIGYALWREGDSANGLLGRVDAALYEAKGAGRNQVQKAA